jgi:hypothetical protein
MTLLDKALKRRAEETKELCMKIAFDHGYRWIEPRMCASHRCVDLYFLDEGVNGLRELHIDHNVGSTDYARVWGINIDTEMKINQATISKE